MQHHSEPLISPGPTKNSTTISNNKTDAIEMMSWKYSKFPLEFQTWKQPHTGKIAIRYRQNEYLLEAKKIYLDNWLHRWENLMSSGRADNSLGALATSQRLMKVSSSFSASWHFPRDQGHKLYIFWAETKSLRLVTSIDAAIANPGLWDSKKRQYFCLFSLFLLKMALVTSWLLSKMNSVTVPMLCTRQWRAKIRFQMCPTYVSKYCNTDKYFSAIYSQNTKLLSRAALCCTIWLLLCFCLSAFLFIRT